ncbi:MAG: TPM domain-containing protein [Thiocapsa sp.]|nr:TPM domain-containing protein [Thiocapsa sp.]MCG6985226.1 TPM domain-containing protein [Thiocapsa sp.]
MRKALTWLSMAVVILGAASAWTILNRDDDRRPEGLASFTLEARPQNNRTLFDYAGVLRHYEEGAHRYLDRLATRFHIEALIVSIPALPAGHTTATLAVDLVNRWRIGARQQGRGLLLLLVDDRKEVKLEVAYALEGVFTDAFSGYVEDLQLGPYFRAGDVGTGLIAVMEMLEARAQLAGEGDYDPDLIAASDAGLLSGGAGARRELARIPHEAAPAAGSRSDRGASSPEEAWEIMLAKWAGEGGGGDVEVYTEMTRLAMGAVDRPPRQTLRWLEHWRDADYQVLRDGDHAVIWFGAIDGWENSPFLFCNTGNGWKFDVVWQRRLVVMAESPKWEVMQGPFPYVAMMDRATQSTGKDLPLSEDDLYRCPEDTAIAARIAELRAALDRDPDDPAAALALLRLNVITDQAPALVRPLIERAKALAAGRAATWKYAAIYNVNSVFQYRTALAEIGRFIDLRPDDPFGHDMRGFLHYRLGEYRDSIDALERAVELDPDDGYAFALMAHDYTMLARKARGLDRDSYRKRALEMQRRAAGVSEPDMQRLAWLEVWLGQRL